MNRQALIQQVAQLAPGTDLNLLVNLPIGDLAAYVQYLTNGGAAVYEATDLAELASRNFRDSGVSQDTGEMLEDEMPVSAFRSGIRRRGLPTSGTLGQVLQRQFAPTQGVFSFGRATDPKNFERSFETFTRNTPNPYQAARTAFGGIKDLAGDSATGAGGWGSEFARDAIFRSGTSIDPEREGEIISSLAGLARDAGTAKFGPFGARFLPSTSAVLRGFDDELFGQSKQAGAPGVNAWDYFRKAFGHI